MQRVIERLEPRQLLTSVFYSKADYAAGLSPFSVAAADFNQDSTPDLAVASQGTNAVSVLMNDGNGTFAEKVAYATGREPNAVVSGDFNGDGKADLAVANKDGMVSVLMNQGGGVFAAKVDYTAGSGCFWLTSADFNRDGRPDLAVTDINSNTVSVLLNKGDGAFADKVDYSTGSMPMSVTSGDFDGDGWIDLAAANYSGATVSILRNNGDGTFAARIDYATIAYPFSVTSADLNGDGKPDLATSSEESAVVSVLLNNGNGTFATKVDYATGSGSSVVSADFSGDGKPDLAVANYNGDSVSVLLNNGNGTFATKVDCVTGNDPISLASADFNNDGKPDLAVANFGSGTISVLLNQTTTVTINQAATQADPTNASTIHFTAVFSNPVTGFTGDSVVLGGTAGATTATITGSGDTYDVAVSGMTKSGTVIASIPAGVAIGAAGNPNRASISTDNTVTFDCVAPKAWVTASTIKSVPKQPYRFKVTYSDDLAIKASTVGAGDIVVYPPKTVRRYKPTATWIKPKTRFGNTKTIVTYYSIPAPGGRWDATDNGTYSVVLTCKHIRDLAGNAIAPKKAGLTIGTFKVAIGTRIARLISQGTHSSPPPVVQGAARTQIAPAQRELSALAELFSVEPILGLRGSPTNHV